MRKQEYLIYFTALSAGVLLISNLAAVKLWNLAGIPVDGGLVCFPITYMLGDLIVEFYGKTLAKKVVYAGLVVNILAAVVFYIVIALPSYPGWTMQEAYASVLGFTPRIIAASLLSFVCSNLFNNHVFVQMKESGGVFTHHFIARALGSSAVARIIDSGIFETVAFFGVLPFGDFLHQAIFAYVAGFAIECALSPVENKIQKHLKRSIGHAE